MRAVSEHHSMLAERILWRSNDVQRINELVNRPDIRPFVGGYGELDLTEAVQRPEHWFLIGEYGGFALIWSAPRVYEVHTFVMEAGRGSWANDAAREMIAYAGNHGARMLWTKISPSQPHVRAFARAHGMQDDGLLIETFGLPYRVYSMEVGTCQ